MLTTKGSFNPTLQQYPQHNHLREIILRAGVVISAGLIVVGLGLFILSGSNNSGDYTLLEQTKDHFPTNPLEIWQGLATGKPFAIIMAGFLCLVITPILNLIVVGLDFLQQKNRVFSVITLAILAILTLSFLLG